MDYINWSQEYITEAEKILSVIEQKKHRLSGATLDERHTINADIIKLRNIYYDCMLIAKHLSERAGVNVNAA